MEIVRDVIFALAGGVVYVQSVYWDFTLILRCAMRRGC